MSEKPMKQPRKVALIDVRDFPRDKWSAYWTISVQGDDAQGYLWRAHIHAYEPVGWEWQGKVTEKRPDAPIPVYPADIPVRQDEFVRMDAAAQAAVMAAQEKRRQECARIYEAHPKPVYLLQETMGTTDTRDAADEAAQRWVLAQMPKYKRPVKPEAGYALALGPAGMLWESLTELFWRLFGPLLALSFSGTVRNNRLTALRDAIDGGTGAGLWRIYDGSRPSTCGTATTMLAEITLQDPCGTVSSQVLTFSGTPLSDTSANATGTASWFRIVDSSGTCCVDGNVGTSGSDLNLNTTSITSGVQVTVSSATITEGNA